VNYGSEEQSDLSVDDWFFTAMERLELLTREQGTALWAAKRKVQGE